MISVAKKLSILMWKSVVLRRRNWLLSLLELVCPFLVTFIPYYLLYYSTTYQADVTGKEIIDGFVVFTPHNIFNFKVNAKYIAYTPCNNFTDTIMTGFSEKLNRPSYTGLSKTISVESKNSQADLEEWLKNRTLMNKLERVDSIGIVFLTTDRENKTFKYKIRTTYKKMLTDNMLTKDLSYSLLNVYRKSSFLSVQIHLDMELLKSIAIDNSVGERLLGKMPVSVEMERFNPFKLNDYLIFLLPLLVLSVSKDVRDEKIYGMKELMKIMGVSPWMIWAQWLMHTLLVYLPVCMGIAFITTVLEPPLIHSNPFIVLLLFLLFTINYTVLVFITTCFLYSSIRDAFLSACFWVLTHYLTSLTIPDPGNIKFYMQVLQCLLPLNNLSWALDTINSFSKKGQKWSLKNLFDTGFAGSHIPIGLSIFIFILESLILTVILLYLDAILPGPYGVAKPVTFVCHWLKNKFKFSTQSYPRNSSYLRISQSKNFQPPIEGAKTVIEIRGLYKEFRWLNNVTIIDNLNLDIYRGEILALLGHNGSGKTTLMHMITGMIPPTRGNILYEGTDINSSLSDFRKNLGLCTQHNMYLPKLTVIEHLLFFSMLKGMSYDRAKFAAIELLDLLKIKEKYSKSSKISGGMLRKLCLAVSLIGEPKVLILDEPNLGIDLESRHYIWNILLNLRGKCTIIFSTHSMEEAHLLGDRIAIMSHGELICSGTTPFLKSLYETGYHVQILKNATSPVENILNLVKWNISNSQVKEVSQTQVDIIIKKELVRELPTLFESLEKNEVNLGIIGISVTYTTMNDIFFKVTGNSLYEFAINNREQEQVSSSMSLAISNYQKATGLNLCFLQLRTLLYKRLLYRYRTIFKYVLTILACSIGILPLLTRFYHNTQQKKPQNSLPLNLSIYADSTCIIMYDEYNIRLAKVLLKFITKHKGKVEILPIHINITKYLLDIAKMNFDEYINKSMLTISLIKHKFTVQYQSKYNVHLPPIAVNLIANILLQNYTSGNGFIEVINHPYLIPPEDKCSRSTFYHDVRPINWTLYFIFVIYLLMSNFINFITEERVSKFKHQHYTSGVSVFLYWFTNFIFDFCIYIVFIIIYLYIFTILGIEEVAFNTEAFKLIIFVLFLNGISGISVVYLFTYLIDSILISQATFFIYNIIFGILPAIAIRYIHIQNFSIFLILTTLLSLTPTYATAISILYIALTSADHFLCRICDILCDETYTCFKMPTDKDRSGILINVLVLAFTSVIYPIALIVIDCKLLERIILPFFYKERLSTNPDGEYTDVTQEREKVKLFKMSADMSINLRVNHLVKKYFCGPKAVNGICFVVAKGECFGLLGMKESGKTTTLKILTGEVFPNSGDAFIRQYSVICNRKRYMSSLGYCPQFAALPNLFTGEEILTMIGHLRGIPLKQINVEVNKWLKKFDLSDQAKKQCNTYSIGNKRKLSVAMAFIGDPLVVFLDEPTTGLDPVARQRVWNVIQARQKTDQAIIITTKSIEECKVLCTRLTVIKDGKMECIGTVNYLEMKFGYGYTVLINLINPTNDKLNSLKLAVKNKFPSAVIQDENICIINYQISDTTTNLSFLFSEMIQLQNEHDIVEDFIVKDTNIETVLLSILNKRS